MNVGTSAVKDARVVLAQASPEVIAAVEAGDTCTCTGTRSRTAAPPRRRVFARSAVNDQPAGVQIGHFLGGQDQQHRVRRQPLGQRGKRRRGALLIWIGISLRQDDAGPLGTVKLALASFQGGQAAVEVAGHGVGLSSVREAQDRPAAKWPSATLIDGRGGGARTFGGAGCWARSFWRLPGLDGRDPVGEVGGFERSAAAFDQRRHGGGFIERQHPISGSL